MQARGEGGGFGRDLGHGLEDGLAALGGIGVLRQVAEGEVAAARDAALGGLFEARDQLEEGGLAPAVLAYEADLLAFENLKVNLIEDGVACVIFADFGELDE